MTYSNEVFRSAAQALFNSPKVALPSAWTGHIPFMFALFQMLQPSTYVELGVHHGASFLAACSAARRFGSQTHCYGIDTWAGDEHAGMYEDGDAIFHRLQALLQSSYDLGFLIRERFENAVSQFEDGSIDVLHIDGLHTYDAVSRDYCTWRPKLSARSVVLFHDICVYERGFGVHRFWAELKTQFSTIEFSHSYGLGVLLHGDEIPDPFQQFCREWNTNVAYQQSISAICDAIGSQLEDKARAADNLAQIQCEYNVLKERYSSLEARSIRLPRWWAGLQRRRRPL